MPVRSAEPCASTRGAAEEEHTLTVVLVVYLCWLDHVNICFLSFSTRVDLPKRAYTLLFMYTLVYELKQFSEV